MSGPLYPYVATGGGPGAAFPLEKIEKCLTKWAGSLNNSLKSRSGAVMARLSNKRKQANEQS